MTDRPAHVEKLRTTTDFGSVKTESKIGGKVTQEEHSGILAQHELTAKEGQAKLERELYFTFEETGSRVALYTLIDLKIKDLRDRASKREALSDEELKPILDLIEWCPGGTEAGNWIKELRQIADEQIFAGDVKKAKESEILKAAEDWDKLRERDLHPSDSSKKTAAEKVEKENEFLADLYLILKAHGIDSQALRLSDVVNESLKREGRNDLLRKIIAAEDTRDNNRLAETRVNNILAANPHEYWQKQLLLAVEDRLKGMRSSAVARLKKGGARQKMEIGRPKNPEHFKKGYSPALVFQTVSDGTIIGNFLDHMQRGAYWRGKASLDVLYWSFYKGALMSNNESRAEAKDTDIFAERKNISHTLRGYGGAVPLSYMEKDPKFIDALNILYNLYKDKTYEQKLILLGQKYKFLVNGQLPDELPDFVADAVMFEKVYVLDALNMSRADLRIVSYHPAQIFDNELATDASGNMMEHQGKVLQFLGKNMRFTESPMIKMGWYDASNDQFNYEAMVPDLREYNPDKYWDQKDKTWQHIFMYLLELNDRRHDLVRKYMNEDEEIQIEGEPMTATPGQTGEYLNYQNERRKRNKGETDWNYDHRRAVFERILAMQTADTESRNSGGQGKAGWNDRLHPDDLNSLTVRQAVDAFVLLAQRDYGGPYQLEINGVIIDKNAGEIFYNDELAALLNDFEANPNDPVFNQHRNELFAFLNMREVLRDHRCWGFVFDLNDTEVHERLFNNMDLTFVENYDIAANEAKSLLIKLTRAPATDDVYALKVTPGQILEAATEFGHRRHNSQNYWPTLRFLGFIEAAMLRRLTEMEIASIQDLSKYIDPMGEVQLGAYEEVQKLIGARAEIFSAHRALLGHIDSKGYMEKMKDQRLVLAEKGLIRNWTNAMRSYVEKLRDAEALQWAQQRDIPLQQMAGMYEEIADGYEASGYLPVESWQVMDVVMEGDKILRKNLLIQSLNRTQMHNFFERMDFEEAGEAFGGARKVRFMGGIASDVVKAAPADSSVEIKTDLIDNSSFKTFLVVRRYFNNEGEWFKLASEEGEPIGWVNTARVVYDFDPNVNEGGLREGEVTYRGGRFMWVKDKKINEWGWQWEEGSWRAVRINEMQEVWVFTPGEGFDRKLKLGTRKSVEVFEKKTGTTVPNNELQATKVTNKMLRVQPANYPFLKFKSEKHRDYFYNMRSQMLLSLLMGRPIRGQKGVGGDVGSMRASGAALPQNMYQAESGNFMQMLQFGYWITTQMRSVELYAACRGALLASLKSWFGVEIPANEIIEQRMELYKMLMQGRLWGTDEEAGEKFVNEISAMAFVRQGDDTFTKRLLRGAQKSAKDSSLRTWATFLKYGIQLSQWKVGQLNGGGATTSLSTATYLVPLSFGAGLAWGWTVGFTAAAYFIGQWGFNKLGAFLAKSIDADIEDADLNQFPYLRQYDAFVVQE